FGHCRDRYGYLTTLVVDDGRRYPDDDADGAADEPSGSTRGPRAWTGHGRVRFDDRRGGDRRDGRAVGPRPEDRLDVQLDGGQPQVARNPAGERDRTPRSEVPSFVYWRGIGVMRVPDGWAWAQ